MAPQPTGKSPVMPVGAPVPVSPRGKASHRFPRHRRGARPPWPPATRPSGLDRQDSPCLTGTSGQSASTLSHQTCARIAGADSWRSGTRSAHPRREGPASRYLGPGGDLVGGLVHHAQRLEGEHAQLALAHGGLQGKGGVTACRPTARVQRDGVPRGTWERESLRRPRREASQRVTAWRCPYWSRSRK